MAILMVILFMRSISVNVYCLNALHTDRQTKKQSYNRAKIITLFSGSDDVIHYNWLHCVFQSLAFIVDDLDMKLTVLGVLQKFSKHSRKLLFIYCVDCVCFTQTINYIYN